MRKSIKLYAMILALPVIAMLSSCEPKALTEQDVYVSEDQLAKILDEANPEGYDFYTLNGFLDAFMTEEGNFKSDSSLYRTRSEATGTEGKLYMFTIDTLPVGGRGIYIRGRVTTDDFGGNFYVEADTLYRNQNGQDMAATLTFPKAKIQSGFTLSMSPTGDPSTFDFVMDAMPGYTYFDSTKKVVCDIMIVGDDAKAEDVEGHEEHKDLVGFKSARIDSKKLTDGSSSDQHIKENNECIKSISVNGDVATLKVDMNGLQSYDSSNSSQGSAKWVGLIIETGEDTLENVTYNGTALTAADIAEATSVGAPAGAFVLWLKADVVQTTPKTITIGTVDGSKESRKVTIKIVAA